MTFAEYWETRGARICVDTHEERAKLAWYAALETIAKRIVKSNEKEKGETAIDT